MKKVVASLLVACALLPAQAQLFSPDAFAGALWGSILGGIAGGNCQDGFSGQGAAIGAGVGLLVGAIAGQARRNEYYAAPDYAYAPATAVSFGYGYGSCGSSAYVYYAPNAYCAPNYYYQPARPNYAVGGTLLGAASGALIGAGSEQAGQGAAIGAAAGLVLGSVAELTTRHREQKMATVAQSVPAAESQGNSQQSQITSQPAPNSTYYWAARPQIPDAPRVPDAPTF